MATDHRNPSIDAARENRTKSKTAAGKSNKHVQSNEEENAADTDAKRTIEKDATSPVTTLEKRKYHKATTELLDLNEFPVKNNPLYNVTTVLDKLKEHPLLKGICGEGKYYLNIKNVVIEKHPKLMQNKRGKVIPTMHTEALGPIENIFRRFCEEVLSISRTTILPLTSQGERHLIWVGRIKAKHIIKFLNGNGCYVVNRFPGDVFLKDKQVMGVTLRQYMLERKNACSLRCGAPKAELFDEENEDSGQTGDITYRICPHMVRSMRTDNQGCTEDGCYNFEKQVCKHFDVFIPEVQSFCLYNSLQDFSNRLDADLKGQMFICKPAYLYKGLGFRFFYRGAEFEEFYHMSVGKETSRHDFLVQRVVSNPYLFDGRKVDVRAFVLLVTLRYRRVVAFVNPGFCRVASVPYEQHDGGNEDEPIQSDADESLTGQKQNRKQEEKLRRHMQMLVCTYQTDSERAERTKRMKEKRLFTDEEDRSKTLNQVFEDKAVLTMVKKQIKHIGKRLAEGIEKRIWDSYGCYQIFSLDMCVDANNKVWLLEVNSHAMSEVDILSPTQRVLVPAVMMEALGLVAECMFKSANGMRLRKSPSNEFQETGFLFACNFEMVFSTLTRKRTNYRQPHPPPDNGPPFFERITAVDNLMRKAKRYKQALDDIKKKMQEDKLNAKKRRAAKKEEHS